MTRVAIIGAGCAGLAAAQMLLVHGKEAVEVVLIDAFERLGGRAWTNSDQGFAFDLGPQFIQDPDVNPWLAIAKALQFETLRSNPNTMYRIFDEVWKDLPDPPAGVAAVSNHLDKSYGENAELKNAPAIQQLPVNEDTCLALGSNTLGSIGEFVEPWQYIASDNARQVDPEGAGDGVVYVTEGLGTLVEEFGRTLQQDFPAQLTTKTGEVVTCVRWDPGKGEVEVLAGHKSLCTAQFCIVSVPCSAVARIAFVPPLEQKRVVANGYIELGSYKKIAFKPKAMPGEIAELTEYYLYDEELKGCWQYFRLPTAEDALIGVASGNFAARLDRLDDREAAAAFIGALNNAYPDSPIEPGEPPLVTNWSNQQHIWGAYSYTRYDGGNPDDPTAFEARAEIGKPDASGHILFAGEATWTEAYGTIHGAYYSGRRAAREILNSIGLTDIAV